MQMNIVTIRNFKKNVNAPKLNVDA